MDSRRKRLWTDVYEQTHESHYQPRSINTLLKQLEKEAQRTHDEVTIDLDLMQYDSEQYHPKDWPRPYIQQLIPDIL